MLRVRGGMESKRLVVSYYKGNEEVRSKFTVTSFFLLVVLVGDEDNKK